MVANVGGCPVGICIVNGKVVFFALPWYICKVITTSSEESRLTQRAADEVEGVANNAGVVRAARAGARVTVG